MEFYVTKEEAIGAAREEFIAVNGKDVIPRQFNAVTKRDDDDNLLIACEFLDNSGDWSEGYITHSSDADALAVFFGGYWDEDQPEISEKYAG